MDGEAKETMLMTGLTLSMSIAVIFIAVFNSTSIFPSENVQISDMIPVSYPILENSICGSSGCQVHNAEYAIPENFFYSINQRTR